MAETADVIIVGAGIMGVSTAYHLAQRGFGTIVVLERDTVCSGSTALASGGIRHQYANRVGIELTLMAELIADGCASTLDISPLSLERFARGESAVEPLTFVLVGTA